MTIFHPNILEHFASGVKDDCIFQTVAQGARVKRSWVYNVNKDARYENSPTLQMEGE
jgi:hypothetical protein